MPQSATERNSGAVIESEQRERDSTRGRATKTEGDKEIVKVKEIGRENERERVREREREELSTREITGKSERQSKNRYMRARAE